MSDTRKPLELTIYRHCNCVAYCTASIPADMEGPDIFGAREGSEDHVRHPADKRLTDAELAAETYRALSQHLASDGYAEVGFPDLEDPGEFGRALTFERFATLPHYDEERA